MVPEDFDSLFSLEKTINETVEKETDLSEEYFIGGLFLEREEDSETEMPKRRGRPKGVKESVPRKRVSKIREIKERIVKFVANLKRLEEIIKKQGSQYVLYSKDKKKKLGTFKSKKAALAREKQIQFFKNKG